MATNSWCMSTLTTTTGFNARSKSAQKFIICIRRDEFVLVIRWAYKKLAGKVLPVFGVKFKNLKEFTTTKKDRKRGLTRMPGESMRIDPVYD